MCQRTVETEQRKQEKSEGLFDQKIICADCLAELLKIDVEKGVPNITMQLLQGFIIPTWDVRKCVCPCHKIPKFGEHKGKGGIE